MENRHILLVDDNEDDLFFMLRALEAAKISSPVKVMKDGAAAKHYLAGLAESGETVSLPCLVLLDIQLPVMTGLEVLAWIRQDKILRDLVVVMLTTSKQSSDVKAARALGANSFLSKPILLDELNELARRLKGYWLESDLLGKL